MKSNNSFEMQSKRASRIVPALVLVVVTLMASMAFAEDDDTLVKFRGGIGVVPVTGVNATTGAPTLNVVRNVNPGGPWRIAALEANVDVDGHIQVKGKGLLLAAGNGIGTNANQTVHATLFCGAATSPTSFDTVGVPLAVDGDFTIEDTFTGLPSACANPVLLIRNAGGVWFAAGIPSFGR